MSDMSESERPAKRRNPLIWVALVVIGLIIYLFLNSDRGAQPPGAEASVADTAGTIERNLLVPPGMRARQYISRLRESGDSYALSMVQDKADQFLQSGNLADAHLLYFFAAREGHLEAMMKLGELSDPTLFRAEDSLLDNADAIQAYKWYQKAAALGYPAAADRVTNLQHWALAESRFGNAEAKQLLLNF